MKSDTQPCALRALFLCDGQVLEDSDHTLTTCPHKVLSDEELSALHVQARLVLTAALDESLPRTSLRRDCPSPSI